MSIFFLVFTVFLHSTMNQGFVFRCGLDLGIVGFAILIRVLVKADSGSGLLSISSSIRVEQSLLNLIQSVLWISHFRFVSSVVEFLIWEIFVSSHCHIDHHRLPLESPWRSRESIKVYSWCCSIAWMKAGVGFIIKIHSSGDSNMDLRIFPVRLVSLHLH